MQDAESSPHVHILPPAAAHTEPKAAPTSHTDSGDPWANPPVVDVNTTESWPSDVLGQVSAAGQVLEQPERPPGLAGPIEPVPAPIGSSKVLDADDSLPEFGSDGMPRKADIYNANNRNGCYRDTATNYGWEMPGGGPKSKLCGKYTTRTHIDGEVAPTKTVKHSCNCLTCCVCFPDAIMMRAVGNTKRGAGEMLFDAISGNWYPGKTSHTSIDPASGIYARLQDPLEYEKWISEQARICKEELHLVAFDFAAHPWRFSHGKRKKHFEPHVHAMFWQHIPNEQYEPETNFNRNDRKLRDLHEFGHAFNPIVRLNRQKIKINRDIEARSRPLTDNPLLSGYDSVKVRINGEITKVSLDALRSLLHEIVPENPDCTVRLDGCPVRLDSDSFKVIVAGDPVAAGLHFSIVTVGFQRKAATPLLPHMRTIYEMHDPVRSAKNEIFLRNYLGTHIGLHPGARDLSTGKHKKHNAPIWRHYGDVANLKVETCLSNWSMAIPALIGKPKSTDKAGRVSKATGLNSFLYPGGKPLDSVKVTAAVLPHELTSLDYGKVVIDKVYQAMPGQDQRLFTSLMPSFECSPAQFVARLPGMLTRAGVHALLPYLAFKKSAGELQAPRIVKTTPLPKDGPMSRLLRASFPQFSIPSAPIKPGKPPPSTAPANHTSLLLDILRLQTLPFLPPAQRADYLVLLLEGRLGNSVRRCAVFVDPNDILLCPCHEKLRIGIFVDGKLPDELPLPGTKGSGQLVVIPSYKVAYYDPNNDRYGGIPGFNHGSRKQVRDGIKEVPSFYDKLEPAAQVPIRNEIVYSAAKWAARQIKLDIERQSRQSDVYVKVNFQDLVWTALDYMHSEPLPADLSMLASKSLVAGVWRVYARNAALSNSGSSAIPAGFQLTLSAFDEAGQTQLK